MTRAMDDETRRVFEKIEEYASVWEETAAYTESEGKLTAESAAKVKETGVVRMLQPKEFGGMESHPVDYLKAVLEIGVRDGSAGWVAGVVGIHPHELAQGTRQLQEELWGEDPDTWIASPYMPGGKAIPVDGGYRFSGRWMFSSGTDHCTWVTIGGLICDADGNPVPGKAAHHFCLPREDYEIVEGSWEVMGLKGTGSKDLIVNDVFVPEHRVIDTEPVTEGAGAVDPARDTPLYRMPRNIMFSGAITGATLALAKGALNSFVDWTQARSNRFGTASTDPFQLFALAAAGADIDASILVLLNDIEKAYDKVAAGQQLSFSERAEIRRNQVRASHRAAAAANEVFKVAGGSQLHLSNPMQRRWRDSQAALHHIQTQEAPLYHAYGLDLFGHEVKTAVKI